MTLFTRWDHIHFRSGDPDSAAVFYESVLGGQRRARLESGDQLRVTVDLAGVLLFIDRAEPGTTDAPGAPVYGVDHLALTVPSLDEALIDVTRSGVEVLSGPTEIRAGLRVAFLRAPDGVRVELLERKEAA